MTTAKKPRNMTMRCPHCTTTMVARTTVNETPCSREARLVCPECMFSAVAQVILIRQLTPSVRPNPAIILPIANPNLQHFKGKHGNDDTRPPANDEMPPAAEGAAT